MTTPPLADQNNSFFMRRNTDSGGSKRKSEYNPEAMNRIRELEKSLKGAESAAKSNRATILELRQRLHNQESHINETNGKKNRS